MTARRLVIASSNRGKIVEIEQLLATAELGGLEVVGAASIGDMPVIDETAADFAGNARLKAEGVARWIAATWPGSTDLVLADDSGLCVDALAGAPGVFSARYAGLRASDEENNAKLVADLRARACVASPAHYEAVIALAGAAGPLSAPASGTAIEAGGGVVLVRGRCDGEIRVEARGSGGFGYDPHFWIDEGARTFAEMTVAEKGRRSHRGAALRELIHLLTGLAELRVPLGAA